MNGDFRALRVVGDVLTCASFFTRLPVAGPTERRLADSIWAAPIAGLLVGTIGGLAFAIGRSLDLPAGIAAILAIAATMLATGCLHEDGLADVADGFGGGATRERKLEIMKDSRIGTYGVAALMMSVLVRWQALAAMQSAGAAFVAMIAAHSASRAIIPAFMLLVPPARSSGLSAGAGAVSATTATVALLLGVVALLFLGPPTTFVSILVLLVWFLLLKALAERHIGGQTGDVLGCLQQGSEVIVLLVTLSLLQN